VKVAAQTNFIAQDQVESEREKEKERELLAEKSGLW
jgi:hypothetical protein